MRTFLKSMVVSLLTWEAKRALKKWKPFIILVSGSVGKTTTKDAIYHVLKESATVRKSEKSFNSEIGVPLTILGLPNAFWSPLGWAINLWKGYHASSVQGYPQVLVLEMGSDHPGDIAQLLRWITPNIVVITRLPELPVHVEFFDSPEALRKEDALPARALKEGGVYIANADDVYALALTKETPTRGVRSITYGFTKHAQLRGVKPRIRFAMREGVERPVGMQFMVEWQGESFPVFLADVLGVPACTAALAAIAVAIARGVSVLHATEALLQFDSPPGRMRVLEGIKGATIIDDTYNSSPVALEAALTTLKESKGGRHIALLGDMLELGAYSEDAHYAAGVLAAIHVDELLTVGRRARGIAEGAKKSGLASEHVHEFVHAAEAGAFATSMLERGDIVLLKGSQGSGENLIRLERAVKMLMAHPEDVATTLVRQEEEWRIQ